MNPPLATTAVQASAAGSYPISVVDAGTLSASNYDFPAANFVNGTQTVGKVHLTVTANSLSRTYGSANPSLTSEI